MMEGKTMSTNKEMDIVGHLTELRNRLMVTAFFFLLFFILGFIFWRDIFDFFQQDFDFPLIITSLGAIIWIIFFFVCFVVFVVLFYDLFFVAISLISFIKILIFH